MNSHNVVFKKLVDKAGLAMSHLVKSGCAITGLSINNGVTVIDILPPRNKKLKGHLISIQGTHTGRQNTMVTRVHGCVVKWHQSANDQLQKEDKRA